MRTRCVRVLPGWGGDPARVPLLGQGVHEANKNTLSDENCQPYAYPACAVPCRTRDDMSLGDGVFRMLDRCFARWPHVDCLPFTRSRVRLLVRQPLSSPCALMWYSAKPCPIMIGMAGGHIPNVLELRPALAPSGSGALFMRRASGVSSSSTF